MIDPLSLLAGAAIYQVGIKHDGDKTHPAQIIIVPQGAAPSGQTTQAPSFYEERIDLTTAHTHLEKTIGPWDFVQASTDGTTLDGVSIKLNRQDAQAISLSSYDVIPVANCNKVYVTNDVRAGRTALTLTFSSPIPLGRYINGEPVGRDELAARLGSIVTFDRRGSVIWLDDFEDNINKWEAQLYGTGAAVALSSTEARNGAKSVLLTTGNAAGDVTGIRKYLPYPTLTKVGFEISFRTNTDLREQSIHIYLWDGAKQWWAILYVKTYSEEIRYFNEAGSDAVLETSKVLYTNVSLFHTMKLVIDPINHRYVRAIVNEKEYDLSGQAMRSTASISTPRMCVGYLTYAQTTGGILSYADDAIVTQNEP